MPLSYGNLAWEKIWKKRMPLLNKDELEKRATYHPPTDAAKRLHEQVRNIYLNAATFTMEKIPESREASIAQTKLEEFLFWTNAAIARNISNVTSER